MIDNKWKRMIMSAKLSFFGIKQEPITKHPKKDPSNQRPWRGPFELRTDLAKQPPKNKYEP